MSASERIFRRFVIMAVVGLVASGVLVFLVLLGDALT